MPEIFKFFPTAVYVEKLFLNKKQLEKTIKLCTAIQKHTPDATSPWVGQTYSTIRTHDIVKDKNFEDIVKGVTHHVNLFNKEFLSEETYKPQGGWVNIYSKTYHYQESHIHANSMYSAVVFLQSNKYSSPLYIEKANEPMVTPRKQHGFNDLTYNTINFKPIPGQLIVFRSDVRHFVPPSVQDNKRITLAFNY
jgi:uncharacterized protein (TIGR02466 family)